MRPTIGVMTPLTQSLMIEGKRELIDNPNMSVITDHPCSWATEIEVVPYRTSNAHTFQEVVGELFFLEDPLVKKLLTHQAIAKYSNWVIWVDNGMLRYEDQYLLAMLTAYGKPVYILRNNQWLSPEDVGNLLNTYANQDYTTLIERIQGPPPFKAPERVIGTPNGATLRAYQQQMVDFVLEKKRAGLFVDMGLGKTLSTLAIINEWVKRDELDIRKPILLVAPKTPALDTWSREAEKWGYDFEIKVNIDLTPKKRTALLETLLVDQTKPTILTTNPGQLKALVEFFIDKHQRPDMFDLVVVDELSLFKAPETYKKDQLKTGKTSNLLRRFSDQATKFIGLTGTPAPNNLEDLYNQLVLIDGRNKNHFGSNFYKYQDWFFKPTRTDREGRVIERRLKPTAEFEIYRRMRHSTISFRTEGLLELPDIVYVNDYVTLPPKAQKTYDEIAKLTIEDLDNGASISLDESERNISNAAVKQGKLLQLANGAIYEDPSIWDGQQVKYTTFHDAKLVRLKEIVETATSPILVFVSLKSDMDRLANYISFRTLGNSPDETRKTISEWNSGNIPVLVINPFSTSYGLNIQDGGHTIVWLSMIWNNEKYLQANKRLHRSGQKKTVTVIHLVAKGTVDEGVVPRLNTKTYGQDKLMEALDPTAQ